MSRRIQKKVRGIHFQKWVRGACFLFLALFMLDCIDRVLCVKSPHGVDQARYLYVQPRNRIDVLFLGSSHVHCNIDTGLLWREHGIAAYLCTTAEQPLWNSYHYLVEAQKTQRPRLVVLDMFGPARFYDDYQEKWLEQNLCGMRPSWNKYQMIRASTTHTHAAYLLGYPYYHTRYDSLTEEDFSNFPWNRRQLARWKGFTSLEGVTGLTEPDVSHVTQTAPMTEKSQLYFDKITALCEKEGIPLLLVSAPYLLEDTDQMVYNAIAEQARERGIPFINYNQTALYREMGLDFSQDFADHAHLNAGGAQKYTRHLGNWLASHYQLPDRRGQSGYQSWETQIIRQAAPE